MANTKKELDITKIGPQNYRQLQEANEAKYIGNDSDLDEFMSQLKPIRPLMDPYENATQEISLPDIGETPWGESMFDKPSTTISGLEHLQDIRANNQPWYAKIGAGLAKGAVLAGTTFLNGTLGLAYGIGSAINDNKWSSLWDNEFSNAMDEFNQWSEKVMPNYYTQDEVDNPMSLRNIFSANFLGDKFIKNIGFTVGAFYSGGVYSKGLGAILNAVKASTKANAIVQQGVGSVLSAVNEGSFEALNGANEFENKYKPTIDENYKAKINIIQEEYEANKGKNFIKIRDEYGEKLVDTAYIKYQQSLEKERDNYNKAIAKLQEDKAKVGNTILLLNIPILTASNIYQFGKLYSKGFNTARKTLDITGEPGKYAAKNTGKLSRVARILGGGIAEGNEEVAQQLATDTQQHYYSTDYNNFYRSLQDPEAARETLDWTKSFSETLSRTLGEESTWEQFMIGGMTGLLGMPRFRNIKDKQGKFQSPIVLQENMISKWKELSQESARNEAIAKELNARVNSSEFKNYYQGLIRHKKYQNDMDEASLRDDEFDFKNAEHAQLLSDIDMFNKAGRLEDLKALVSNALDTSDSNLDAIVRNTTIVGEEGKLLGPYAKYAVKNNDGTISSNFGNNDSKQEMIESLSQDKDEMMNTIKEYEEIRNEIDSNSGYRFTDEQLDELTWMKSQLSNWSKRAGDMASQMKNAIGNVIGKLESQRQAAETIRFQEGMAHAELSENYNRADKIIQSIDKAIKNLKFIKSLEGETMVATLSKNPNILEGLKEQIDKLDNGVMSADHKNNIIKKLNDLSRLGSASDLYQKKFTEYLFNPTKIDEDHAKIDEENTEKNADIDKASKIDALNNTVNFQEVQELISSGEVSVDDLDKSKSEAAREYKKASLFKDKAVSIINSSDSEYKSELLDMLNRRFNENTTYNDLSDEALVTDLPLEATTWDEKTQESLENEFNNVLKLARDKVNSGSSQKQNVEAKKTGTKKPENVGKDDVSQPPTSKKFDISTIISNIDKLNIEPEIRTEAKALASIISKNIETLEKSKDIKLARKIQRDTNTLYYMVGDKVIAELIDRVKTLTKSETLNTSSLEEVLKSADKEASSYKPTAVTGVLKAVVPQFDLDAKKDGILIDFVGDGRNEGYTYIYNKLKEVNAKTGRNAFDYVNEGNIKEGDELEVRYEEASDTHPELLALYHKDVLVNYMNTDETIEGVKEIKDKAKKNAHPTVRVSKIMDGQYGYDRTKTQSIGDLLGVDDATIGVMKNRYMEANTDKFVEPVFDEANSDGKVYLLLPNSKGTLSAKQVYIRHLNKTEFDLNTQNNPIANDIKNAFNSLANLVNLDKGFDEALDNIYIDLIDLLYIPDSFHINIISKANEIRLQIAFPDRNGNRQNRNILLKRFPRKSIFSIGVGDNQDTEAYTATPEEVYNQVVDAFYEANLAFNVNAKKLTGRNSQAYANKLRDSNVLATYLTGKRMQGTWFLLNEKPNTTHTDSAFERQKASKQAKGGTRVQFEGNEYFVRNGIIFDQTGSIKDLGSKAQQVKDLAYINAAYGLSYFGVNQHNGKVLILDKAGKRGYNRNTNKYLTEKELNELETILEGRKSKASITATAVKSLLDSQKMVRREEDGKPDTSKNSKGESVYYILEEDNQYHEYARVHSVIGSNYIGPSKGNEATSRGSIVDEIARQFLIDPTSITKPEEISDEAFGALKRGLGKFRDDATRRGFKLVTDRIVLFHKYSDGRRIAGELDVFAYNPSTGEVIIFDFKTSKYSTKDSGFSRVERPDIFVRSTKAQYTMQLSAYAKLFEDSFNLSVSKLIIVPFQLRYSKDKSGGIARINPENYVELPYQNNVFSKSDSTPKNSLKTIQGQYVTMAGGKVEYHKADLQELFTTNNGQTFHLAKIDNNYKLILPNGRSMTIDSALISDEVGRTRNNIMNFMVAEDVSNAIQEALKTNPLENSPYGNSVNIAQNSLKKESQIKKPSTPIVSVKPRDNDRIKKGLEAMDRLDALRVPASSSILNPHQEALDRRSKDEKATIDIDTSTPLGRSQLARKKWVEMTEVEKSLITPMFEGMDEQEIQKYWDGTDAVQREAFIPSCK